MSHSNIREIRTRLYIDFLRSLALEEPSLQDIIVDITLASILTDSVDIADANPIPQPSEDVGVHSPIRYRAFEESELLTYGIPARHHLNSSTKQRLLEEIQTTLLSVMEFFYGDPDVSVSTKEGEDQLPEALQLYKDEIESFRQEVRTLSCNLTELIFEIDKNHEDLDCELNQAITTRFPAHDATRSVSIDLLAATIESSLIKLSLTRARSERTVYHHQSNRNANKESKNMASAISAAYAVLKKDEKDMKAEGNSLDRQLQEYETLLQLVDGGGGGYQQIINDWTKVKQETDECLKDLRRLGWSGD